MKSFLTISAGSRLIQFRNRHSICVLKFTWQLLLVLGFIAVILSFFILFVVVPVTISLISHWFDYFDSFCCFLGPALLRDQNLHVFVWSSLLFRRVSFAGLGPPGCLRCFYLRLWAVTSIATASSRLRRCWRSCSTLAAWFAVAFFTTTCIFRIFALPANAAARALNQSSERHYGIWTSLTVARLLTATIIPWFPAISLIFFAHYDFWKRSPSRRSFCCFLGRFPCWRRSACSLQASRSALKLRLFGFTTGVATVSLVFSGWFATGSFLQPVQLLLVFFLHFRSLGRLWCKTIDQTLNRFTFDTRRRALYL